MKGFKTVSVIALVSAMLAGCGSSAAASTSSSSSASAAAGKYDYLLDTTDLKKPEIDKENATGVLKDVLDRGTLKIVTSPDFPPDEWIDDSGTVYGSEMMLAKYIADSLGVELSIETMEFASAPVAVDTGKADLAISGFGWKKDRAENYALSKGYVTADSTESNKHTLIVKASDADKYHSLEDFVGKHIVAQVSSLQEMYVQDEIVALDPDGETEYEPVSTLDQAILNLASGKCDAVALANAAAENYVEKSDGQFALTNIYFDLTPYGDYQGNVVLAKKGEDSLMDAVNACIDVVNDNNYYDTWYQEAEAASAAAE